MLFLIKITSKRYSRFSNKHTIYSRMSITALHRLLKRGPASLRRDILPYAMGRLIASPLVAGRQIRSGPLVVAGLLRSVSGLGEGARLNLAAFRELGFETQCFDFGKFFYWHNNLSIKTGPAAKRNEGGVIIVHLNPPEMAMLLPLLGRGLLRHRKIIGYWVWELSSMPENWKIGFRFVDEIWVPSRFAANAISKYSKVPIRIVPHPVRTPSVSPLTRQHFGLDERAFVEINMFDLRSSAERKNPFGAIRSFRMAFDDRGDTLLIVKVNNALESHSVMARLQSEVAGYNNVRIMTDSLSSEDQTALLRCADVIISLHRSEGFGLVLAEAMRLGKPVIATGYSANTEYMTDGNAALIGYKLVPVDDPQRIYVGKEQYWAEPNIEEAAKWLKRLATEIAFRRELGEAARMQAARTFSIEAFADAIGDAGKTTFKSR